MDQTAYNPAAAQFVRRRSSETKAVVGVFAACLLVAGGVVFLFDVTREPIAVPADTEEALVSGIPSDAQALTFDAESYVSAASLIAIPGISLSPVAAWKEQAEGRPLDAQLFEAPLSAADFSRSLEISAGLSGLGLSARSTSAQWISYTFFAGGKSGDIVIIPVSASTSRIIIKL